MNGTPRLHGVVAEFDSPDSLLASARALSSAGYTKMDAFTPFPVHGLDKALGLGRSRLGYVVFGAGLVGMVSNQNLTPTVPTGQVTSRRTNRLPSV